MAIQIVITRNYETAAISHSDYLMQCGCLVIHTSAVSQHLALAMGHHSSVDCWLLFQNRLLVVISQSRSMWSSEADTSLDVYPWQLPLPSIIKHQSPPLYPLNTDSDEEGGNSNICNPTRSFWQLFVWGVPQVQAAISLTGVWIGHANLPHLCRCDPGRSMFTSLSAGWCNMILKIISSANSLIKNYLKLAV